MKNYKGHPLEPPRRRLMNDDSRDDFVAIDFETATGLPTSACALGMVKIIDGEIVQQFYTIINPIRDEYTDRELNVRIHGITLEIAEKAQTFDEIFEGIKSFIGGLPLVCHNKGADITILNQLMDYYGLSGIKTNDAICTYELTGLSLSRCCEEFGIPKDRHHNALWDAETCARIYLNYIGKPLINRTGNSLFESYKNDEKRMVLKEHRIKLNLEEIENKNTIFFNAKVVITGIFGSHPNRDDLAAKLQKLGAKINSSISKSTNIVVIGEGAGPKKLEKIREYNEEGCFIKMIMEPELLSILSEVSMLDQ